MGGVWVSLRKVRYFSCQSHSEKFNYETENKVNTGLRKRIISFFCCWLGTVQPVLLGTEMLEAFLIVGC